MLGSENSNTELKNTFALIYLGQTAEKFMLQGIVENNETLS